jgi:hypothetical protein
VKNDTDVEDRIETGISVNNVSEAFSASISRVKK